MGVALPVGLSHRLVRIKLGLQYAGQATVRGLERAAKSGGPKLCST